MVPEYREFSSYENLIFISRYARWIESENRRETWLETVNRVVTHMMKHTKYNKHIPWEDIRQAILNRDVMPSMRVMMSAGPALDGNHIAAYNCSFADVDSLEVFSEALYILMHGTGLGFSVRQESVDQLPVIKRRDSSLQMIHQVQDSKEGWRDSVGVAVRAYAEGWGVRFDYSKVRPEGARLKTFGGRASGPGPLKELHEFLDKTFKNAAGRKLTTLECHSIMCKIGAVVVVGGVRRSALISLSDLDDQDMATAKDGEWWIHNDHFALANNSAVYKEKPCRDEFNGEWATLQASGSGERGIFNRESATKKFEEIGRTQIDVVGTNPCGEILLRDGQFCNLTEVVVRPEDTIADLIRKVEIATLLGTIQSTYDDIKGLRKKWVDNTMEERLLGVSLTGIMDNENTNGTRGKTNLKGLLEELRTHARDTNEWYARVIGVNPSAAITTVKPSGTVSQLCGSSSGIHPAYSKKYIRRIRMDRKDPLTQLMIDQGIPNEQDFYNDKAVVFSFPIDRGDSLSRSDFTAREFLDIWLTYKNHWTDHNPSVTISVKEHEWDIVGDWVYENFDSVGGLSFLPWDSGTYKQAPYEEVEELPEEVSLDLSRLPEYENEDGTTDEKGLACSAGVCEI